MQIETKEKTAISLDSDEVRTAIVEKIVMEGLVPCAVLKGLVVDFDSHVELTDTFPGAVFDGAIVRFDKSDVALPTSEEEGPPVHVGKLLESLRGSLNVLGTNADEGERGRGWREAVEYLQRIVRVFAGVDPNKE